MGQGGWCVQMSWNKISQPPGEHDWKGWWFLLLLDAQLYLPFPREVALAHTNVAEPHFKTCITHFIFQLESLKASHL